MRDERERDGVNARIALQLAAHQLGQFPVVASGEVFADFAQLLFDDMEIIDQPFGGGRDGTLFANGLGERAVGRDQLPPVLFEARQESSATARPLRHHMLRGERRGVLFETLDAEQLFANRRLVARLRSAARAPEQESQKWCGAHPSQPRGFDRRTACGVPPRLASALLFRCLIAPEVCHRSGHVLSRGRRKKAASPTVRAREEVRNDECGMMNERQLAFYSSFIIPHSSFLPALAHGWASAMKNAGAGSSCVRSPV